MLNKELLINELNKVLDIAYENQVDNSLLGNYNAEVKDIKAISEIKSLLLYIDSLS